MDFKFWLKPQNLEITAFFPYTSSVGHPFLTQNHNYKTEEHEFLEELGNALKDRAIILGCNWDNKVVLEVKLEGNFKSSKFYIGKYDGKWSVGLSMYQDPWLEAMGRNKYFEYPN